MAETTTTIGNHERDPDSNYQQGPENNHETPKGRPSNNSTAKHNLHIYIYLAIHMYVYIHISRWVDSPSTKATKVLIPSPVLTTISRPRRFRTTRIGVSENEICVFGDLFFGFVL